MITAKEMKIPVPTKKDDEFERTMTSIEKRNGFTEYYYRPGKLKKDTVRRLEELGFTVVILYHRAFNDPQKASYYSSYVCWTKQAHEVVLENTSLMQLGYCTSDLEHLYENIPEKYVHQAYGYR